MAISVCWILLQLTIARYGLYNSCKQHNVLIWFSCVGSIAIASVASSIQRNFVARCLNGSHHFTYGSWLLFVMLIHYRNLWNGYYLEKHLYSPACGLLNFHYRGKFFVCFAIPISVQGRIASPYELI